MSRFQLSPNFWRIQLRQWHWISSAICLAGLLLFAVTGYTLNHAADLEAEPKTVRVEKVLDAATLSALGRAKDKAPLPGVVVAAVKTQTGADIAKRPADVSDDEIFVDLAGPGVGSSVTIIPETGELIYERTTRGTIAVLNDLHKGRHTGAVWSWFIDIMALACVVFSVTGLGLLWLYSKNRAITWPLVAAGVGLPVILFLLFVHT
jgi:uncharacterized protein